MTVFRRKHRCQYCGAHGRRSALHGSDICIPCAHRLLYADRGEVAFGWVWFGCMMFLEAWRMELVQDAKRAALDGMLRHNARMRGFARKVGRRDIA